ELRGAGGGAENQARSALKNARGGRGTGPHPPWTLRARTVSARSVAVTSAAAGGGRGGGATARRRCGRRAGDRHLPPHAAGEVLAVARGLPRALVADVGVERVAEVGRLLGAIGPGDGAQRAGHAGACGERALDRRPEGGAL